jgi:SOS response regulatory protein OraA/RecX
MQTNQGGVMAIADLLHTFINPKSSNPYINNSLFVMQSSVNREQAKNIASRYLNKGNLWIAQKLRNHNCSEEFIAYAMTSLPPEKQRAELLAAEKWYDFEYKDDKIKVIKLAQYLMSHYFEADIAWDVARDFGNIH